MNIIIWIGHGFYPTIKDFVTESARMGVSRRLSKIPKLEYGKSKCYLIHCQDSNNKKPVVFGYFIVEGVELIVSESSNDIQKRLKERGIEVKQITLKEALQEQPRGCGFRLCCGAMYVVTKGNLADIQDIATEKTIKGPIKMFKNYVPWDGTKFRGFLELNGDPYGKVEVVK